jgi:hypothetical protein
LPAFQRAFDAAGADDQVWHIPQLSLKLQLRDGEDLIAALAALIEQQLARILSSAVATKSARAPARRLAPQASRRQILLEYLATGRLTWHASSLAAPEQVALLRDAAHILAVNPQETIRSLGRSLEARIAASFRLLQLLDASARAMLLKQTAVADAPGAPPLIVMLHRLVAAPSLTSYLQLRLMALLLALRAEDLQAPLPPSAAALLRECGAQLAQLGITDTEFRIAPEAPPAPARPLADRPPPHRFTGAGAARRADSAPAIHAEAQGAAISDDEMDVAAAADGQLVDNAGVVLLHPFLPRLFDVVGVATEGAQALDAACAPRAAALLHWLATGRAEVFEFELALIKVLLGLTPGDPLAVADGLLSDRDRAEADALLAAAIEHWPALGNTSIDGLRVSFLQRRGLLRDGERGWQLQVETESFDVLLGRLPWSIGIMKLPWMTRPIYIDWPTP